MSKESPDQNGCGCVGCKLTDAFGSKGVAVSVIPENELPQDAEGNLADLLRVSNDSLNPHSPGMGGGPRGAMFGKEAPRSDANPLGIESVEELGLLKDMLNQVLTDDQKNALSLLGELTDGKLDSEDPDIVYLTIAVPVDAGMTSVRAAMLEKLLAETPPGGINGHWGYPVQGLPEGAQLPEHHVSVFINDDGDGSVTQLMFREYPTYIRGDIAAQRQRLQTLENSHPVRPGESVRNANVFYSNTFSPLSLSTIREPMSVANGKFVRYATYHGRPATLETRFIEIDGVRMERLSAMTLFSLAGDKSNITLYDLDHDDKQFVLVKVNN